MARVLCNVMESDWAVHFIAPNGKTRIGPWLLLDSHNEVRAILRWGTSRPKRWSNTRRIFAVGAPAVLELSDAQLAGLIERGRGWPWNGYELRLMKQAGRYPPKPLGERAQS
jgi:hypothetical protein